jgi:hypothetical protein
MGTTHHIALHATRERDNTAKQSRGSEISYTHIHHIPFYSNTIVYSSVNPITSQCLHTPSLVRFTDTRYLPASSHCRPLAAYLVGPRVTSLRGVKAEATPRLKSRVNKVRRGAMVKTLWIVDSPRKCWARLQWIAALNTRSRVSSFKLT